MTPTDLETLRQIVDREIELRRRIEANESPGRISYIEHEIEGLVIRAVPALTALLADYERLKAENEQKTHALLTVMRNGTLRATLKGEKHE